MPLVDLYKNWIKNVYDQWLGNPSIPLANIFSQITENTSPEETLQIFNELYATFIELYGFSVQNENKRNISLILTQLNPIIIQLYIKKVDHKLISQMINKFLRHPFNAYETDDLVSKLKSLLNYSKEHPLTATKSEAGFVPFFEGHPGIFFRESKLKKRYINFLKTNDIKIFYLSDLLHDNFSDFIKIFIPGHLKKLTAICDSFKPLPTFINTELKRVISKIPITDIPGILESLSYQSNIYFKLMSMLPNYFIFCNDPTPSFELSFVEESAITADNIKKQCLDWIMNVQAYVKRNRSKRHSVLGLDLQLGIEMDSYINQTTHGFFQQLSIEQGKVQVTFPAEITNCIARFFNYSTARSLEQVNLATRDAGLGAKEQLSQTLKLLSR